MHNQVGCGFIMCIAVCLDMKVMSLQQISNSNSCSSGSIQLYEDTALQLVELLVLEPLLSGLLISIHFEWNLDTMHN
jgi:hypothetical protein